MEIFDFISQGLGKVFLEWKKDGLKSVAQVNVILTSGLTIPVVIEPEKHSSIGLDFPVRSALIVIEPSTVVTVDSEKKVKVEDLASIKATHVMEAMYFEQISIANSGVHGPSLHWVNEGVEYSMFAVFNN